MPESEESTTPQGQTIPRRGWKFRFDAPPSENLSRRIESGDILALFRAWQSANAPSFLENDRRASVRYVPEETRRRLLVGGAGPRFFVAHAELINLSTGAPLVAVDRQPLTSQPIWLCLGATTPTYHAQARVLDVVEVSETCRHLRLVFSQPCPVDFLDAAGRRDEGSDTEI